MTTRRPAARSKRRAARRSLRQHATEKLDDNLRFSPLRGIVNAAQNFLSIRSWSNDNQNSELGPVFQHYPDNCPVSASDGPSLPSMPETLVRTTPRLEVLLSILVAILPETVRSHFSRLFQGLTWKWPRISPSRTLDRPIFALTDVILAILLHHILCMLLPSLLPGSGLAQQLPFHGSSLEDLRLALQRADVFVFEQLQSKSCGKQMFLRTVAGYLVKGIWDMGAGVGVKGENTPSVAQVHAEKQDWKSPYKATRLLAREKKTAAGVLRVVPIIWALSTLEFIFTRCMAAACWIVALKQLVLGPYAPESATALWAALRDDILSPFTKDWGWAWLNVTLNAILALLVVGHYLVTAIIPVVTLALRGAVRGRPSLLLAIMAASSGVMLVLRYRSLLYVPLLMIEVFIVAGHAVCAVVLWGLGALDGLIFALLACVAESKD